MVFMVVCSCSSACTWNALIFVVIMQQDLLHELVLGLGGGGGGDFFRYKVTSST